MIIPSVSEWWTFHYVDYHCGLCVFVCVI